MAAPTEKTIGDLTGKWVMNKSLSDSPEPGLALQGIGFLTRKAIGLATVTLHVKQYTGPHSPPSTQQGDCVHIDIDQTATGGIKGTSENRCLDYEFREHSDWLFGHCKARSKWVKPEELGGVGAEFGESLTKGWIADESEKKGPDGALHVLAYVESINAGWTATQIWGFQTIGGERRYVRNIVITNGDKKVEFRLVYDFVPA